MPCHVKRIYDDAEPGDGYRVLVDRLWPRGVSKDRAQLDLWLKEVAPSPELRTWFGHRADRFAEFTERYTAELDANPATGTLREIVRTHPTVTLLHAARTPEVNHAVVLARLLS
ncbi:hypothetical protein Misp01_32790 [Microtetraspora sp. NBRC 13810]|uniref:DUF488 domain-containing protein n=1 Tax=Microtetraspora sp. NBRC 13810 TaxID=3030990 RepID=UPI0024A5E2F8|nr:DUF488 family protein [Microtetraspora sp. NBRC 13810]GLW08149.1 hypothetical protein Misp01_32790 [Microtetraspora sp. NBRC 13810]